LSLTLLTYLVKLVFISDYSEAPNGLFFLGL